MAGITLGGLLDEPIELRSLLDQTNDAERLHTMLVDRGGVPSERAFELIEELVAAKLEGAGKSVISRMRDRLLALFELRKQVTREYQNLAERLRGKVSAEQLAGDKALFADLFRRLDTKLDELNERNLNADIEKTKKVNVDALIRKLSQAERREATPVDVDYYQRAGLDVLREDAKGMRDTVARDILNEYERKLSDTELVKRISQQDDRLALEVLNERNMRGAVKHGDPFEAIEAPYRLLREQVLARQQLRAAILSKLPEGSRLRLRELPLTPEYLAQAVAASREGEPFTMDVEFWFDIPGVGEFNADGILAQEGGVFTFLEQKTVLDTWENSYFNRDVAGEDLTVMIKRHLTISRLLEGTPFKGFDYSTNLDELNSLIAEKIGELHEPDASRFLHVLGKESPIE